MDAHDLYPYGVLAAFSLFAIVLGWGSIWSNQGPKR